VGENLRDSSVRLGDGTRYVVVKDGRARSGVVVVPDVEQRRHVVGELLRRAHEENGHAPVWVGVDQVPDGSVRAHTGWTFSDAEEVAGLPARVMDEVDSGVTTRALLVVEDARTAFELARDDWETLILGDGSDAVAVVAVVPRIHPDEFGGSRLLMHRMLAGTNVHFGAHGWHAVVAGMPSGGSLPTDLRTAAVFEGHELQGTWTV
jgi:hypothetical protein